MNQVDTNISPQGHVTAIIEYADDRPKEIITWKNQVLRKGREALAAGLANIFSGDFNFFINRMLFGDGGTTGGVPKYVNTDRNGLFGLTRSSKPVISSIDPEFPSQVTFTSVLTFSDANGYVLSEMALQMANGDLYSMSTFPDLTKTPLMQITWNWRLSFV